MAPQASLLPPHGIPVLQFHPITLPSPQVGTPWKHLLGLSPALAPQVLLLLWGGLPNAPTLNYGDEVGLMDPQGEGSDQVGEPRGVRGGEWWWGGVRGGVMGGGGIGGVVG